MYMITVGLNVTNELKCKGVFILKQPLLRRVRNNAYRVTNCWISAMAKQHA